ncbi:MAG: serine/threonine-protein kinase [Thermoanaerobaculia bacterium]|nr:serine/threonine-protein kinase [Thermoanaerobaculia bacterium]
MDADTYRRAGDLFDAALERPVEHRRTFLDEACHDDVELRREIDLLIEHDRQTTGMLDRPVLFGSTSEETADLAEGTRLGNYRIDRVIGRGGMGVVYLATRDDDEFQREVAIKVLASGWFRSQDAWRFHRERQILARLEHPHIAHLYDGGTTAQGHPYFVLEYIDGQAITTYCDLHRLTIRQRLELFLQVCAAVGFAHRNLVVHRDLKPGNILVDAEGNSKLLDFGIAKLLVQDPTLRSSQATQDHQRVLTLSHASPEQVLGQTVTTASDVYCLGLVLYELLCGISPFADVSNKPYELIRRIEETEPPRPSQTFLSASGEAQDDTSRTAAHRSTSVVHLRKALQGDLDAIVTKALRKEPELRYASAAELADDLSRHLENRPILAGSPGAGYRLRKFLRRHRAPVLVASAALLVIVGLVGAFIAALAGQVEHTAREKQKAERMVAFLIETFAVTNPDESIGETVTARELLDAGAHRIANDLQEEPEVQATMLDAMGQIYQQIGLVQPARELLQKALDLRLAGPGTEPSALVSSLTHLGAAYAAGGQIADAEENLQRAVEIGRGLSPDHESTYAEAVESLALLMRQLYRYEDAERLFLEALEIRQEGTGSHPPDLARLQHDYGILLREAGRFDESGQLNRTSLDIRRRYYGDLHPEVAASLEELATVERFLGNFARAEELIHESLALRLAVHGEHHRSIVDVKNSLALVLSDWGRFEEAAVLGREAVDLIEQLSGKTTEWATLASNLAVQLTRLHEFDEAEALFLEALEIRRRDLGDRHPLIGQTLLTLGRLYRRQGHLERAEEMFTRARPFAESLPAGHRARSYPAVALAHLQLELGNGVEAEQLLRPALEELATSHVPGHWRIAMAWADLGRARRMQGDIEEAERHLERALGYLEEAEDDDPGRREQVLSWLDEVQRQPEN